MADNSFYDSATGQQRTTRTINSGVDPASPLAALYSNPYDFTNRFYPRNLASEARGHYINFYINVAQNSAYLENNQYTVYDTGGRTSINQTTGNKTITGYNLNEVINNTTGEISKDIPKVEFGKDIGLSRRTKRISTAIALYMPEAMSVQYNADWQSASLTDAGGKLLAMGQAGKTVYDAYQSGGFSSKTLKNLASDPSVSAALAELTGTAGEKLGLGSGASDFLLYATGSALNPQLEVLFKGLDMRTFQFDFMFAPYDELEAQNVLAIVKTFKFHMAPEVNKSMMGRYFTPPSEFDIDFLFNGQINKNVHQIGTCVLKDMSVDYAPNGWSTFGNGMPTHIKLSLQFMETEIVTKQRVAKDNY